LKVRRKSKFRKGYWLLIGLAAVSFCFALLLLYKPAGYNPPEVARDEQVSLYLTNVLLPQLYNNAQRQEPFDLGITQKGINDIIARSKWPRHFDEIKLSAPQVYFVPDNIALRATVNLKCVELVVTVVVQPKLDEKGLLNLWLVKVKIGAVNMTLPAKVIAKRAYAQTLATMGPNTKDLGTKVAASLLDGEPFEPVFKVKDKKVRVAKVIITDGKLTLHLVPVSG